MSSSSSLKGPAMDIYHYQGSNLLNSNVSTFTAGAAATTSVADANVAAACQVVITPTNGPAGLLLRTKSCWVDTIAAGSFVFNVSASGAGAPAGTETFAYWVSS